MHPNACKSCVRGKMTGPAQNLIGVEKLEVDPNYDLFLYFFQNTFAETGALIRFNEPNNSGVASIAKVSLASGVILKSKKGIKLAFYVNQGTPKKETSVSIKKSLADHPSKGRRPLSKMYIDQFCEFFAPIDRYFF